jgi:hypothetical protein
MTIFLLDPSHSQWVNVSLFNNEKKRVVEYCMEVETGDLYRNDSQLALVVKCALIFFATPFYVVGVMSWYLLRIPVDIIHPNELCHDLRQVVLSPICGFGMQLAMVHGLIQFNPRMARKHETVVESFLWQGISYKDDARMKDLRKGETAKACYLGWCFLKRGNLNDPKFIPSNRKVDEYRLSLFRTATR